MASKLRKVTLQVLTTVSDEDLEAQMQTLAGRHLPDTDVLVWSATVHTPPKLDPTRATTLSPSQSTRPVVGTVSDGYDEEDF